MVKRSRGAGPIRAINQDTYLCRVLELRERLMVLMAAAIKERQWTQAQAAAYLGVSQPRVSDLMQAHGGKFTVETLMQWLMAMGKVVSVQVDDGTAHKKSAAIYKAERVAQAEEAIAFFTEAIRLDPKNVAAYMNRGDQYMEIKQFDLAIGDYTRAIELEPDRPGPRNQRTLAYRFSGQLKAGLQEACEMISLFPDYSGGYAQRAGIYVLLGEYEKALTDFNKDIEMEPDRIGGYLNRANIYEHLGQYQKAIDDFDQVIKLDPSPDWAKEARDAVAQKLLAEQAKAGDN